QLPKAIWRARASSCDPRSGAGNNSKGLFFRSSDLGPSAISGASKSSNYSTISKIATARRWRTKRSRSCGASSIGMPSETRISAPPVVRGMGRVNSREQARIRILSDDEIRTLWKFADGAKGADAVFGRLMKFLLLTGARRGEAAGMTWAELDDTDWILPAARNKTKIELVRPLSKLARSVLPGRTEGSDFIFTADGRPLTGFSNFKSKVKAATGLAGWTPHDLRRTARSLMSRTGVPSD